MGWRSVAAISFYMLFICAGLGVMGWLWWRARHAPGPLASLEERLRATLVPSVVTRHMLWTGIHFSLVVIMMSAVIGGLGGWWYKSIMRGFSERLTETFKDADVVTFQSPEALSAPTSYDANDETDNDGIETSNSFAFNLGTAEGDGEIYEEIVPKLRPRKLEFGKISVTYDGKRTKILTKKDEVQSFIARILSEQVEVRKTHVDPYGLYSLKTKPPVFMTFNALNAAEKYFKDDVAETKRWIWQMFRFGIYLILPLVFLVVSLLRGLSDMVALRTKQNDFIKALLKSGPIKWDLCPEAKLRQLTFPENLKQGPWGFRAQLRQGLQKHMHVFYRDLRQNIQIDTLSLKGRLIRIRATAGSDVDSYQAFIPDNLIPEINEYHSKVSKKSA